MGKVTTQAAISSGNVSATLSEILRGAKIIKIYQREKEEKEKTFKAIKDLTDKDIKINKILIRATPIMEILTGIMIALFIYFCGALIASGEIGINNFFSFLTAMMLSYQPIRSLATINMVIYEGTAASERIFNVIDKKIQIKDDKNFPKIEIKNSNIKFENVSFQYDKGGKDAIKNVNLDIEGEKITALVGHSGG